MQWLKKGSYQLDVKDTKFASGAFRDSFKATATIPETQPSLRVMKQYQDEAVDTITCDLNITLEVHTSQQVQMHMATRCITESFAAKVPLEFGDKFQYNKVYYAVYKQQPVFIEEYVGEEFYKYELNDLSQRGIRFRLSEGCLTSMEPHIICMILKLAHQKL